MDTAHAVEIAERVWWVGHYLPADLFQCHVYLIENGDQSVLIDPGSALTFAETLRKVEEVIPFSHIRYFICQHQDPDITGALNRIDQLISRDDALLVTHWRAQAMLKHYDLKRIPFWRVDEHGWQLDLGSRMLHFIFTPYMHFPGAFCTFEDRDGVLFSSDIFGGFTEHWSLFARDERYFEAIRPFHEHYMPSRDILQHGLARMQHYPVRMIAPQHGSIIPQHLVEFMFERLKTLECGLYLMVEEDTNVNIRHLVAMNRMLQETMEAMVLYREFGDIALHLLQAIRQVLPATAMNFYIRSKDGTTLHLGPGNRYRGRRLESSHELDDDFSHTEETWQQTCGGCCRQFGHGDGGTRLRIPLFSPHGRQCRAIVELELSEKVEISRELDKLLAQLTEPLLTAVDREMIYRTIEVERDAIYERSIRDPLTGLFTRYYMKDTVTRMLELHNREVTAHVGLVMLDIDYFKRINDAWGHMKGDEVLKAVSRLILDEGRSVDVPVRFGGEEFAVFLASGEGDAPGIFAERLREKVARLEFQGDGKPFSITLSAGAAQHRQGESLDEFIHRADVALYTAKEGGRNRVCLADD